MEYKFKKGDRIFVTRGINGYNIEIGDLGTIQEDNESVPFVLFDRDESNLSSRGTAWIDEDMELID